MDQKYLMDNEIENRIVLWEVFLMLILFRNVVAFTVF